MAAGFDLACLDPVFVLDLLQVAGETLQPPRPLPWYSNKLAWHMSFSRGQLRKLPILAEIHELLKRENEAGSITRQEAVSMVPPLFLAVEPHHRVSAVAAAHDDRDWAATGICNSALHTDSGHVCSTWVQDCTDSGDAACWDHDAHRYVMRANSSQVQNQTVFYATELHRFSSDVLVYCYTKQVFQLFVVVSSLVSILLGTCRDSSCQ